MNRKEKVYMDLDGTVLDNTARHYEVYRSVGHWLELDYLPFGKWLELSRAGGVLLPKEHTEEYIDMFQKYFELPIYLQMDKFYPSMREVVENVDHFYDMYVVTLRRDQFAAAKQLTRYTTIYPKIVCSYPETISISAFIKLKIALIRCISNKPTGYIIGDTEYEIIAGKVLGLKTIAVTWGMRDKKTLEQYHPDAIVDRPYEILEAIRRV